jgi:uncharacterized phage-associated protein
MLDSRNVANKFLELAAERGDALTPMQLLKLVYIAHGWTLGLLGRPLIRDDVEAWQYGPVIPRLYNAVRQFKSHPVEGRIKANAEQIMGPEESIIRQVYQIYGDRSGPALSRLTHQKGSPWAAVYQRGEYGTVIPNDVIEDHYAGLAKRANA